MQFEVSEFSMNLREIIDIIFASGFGESGIFNNRKFGIFFAFLFIMT